MPNRRPRPFWLATLLLPALLVPAAAAEDAPVAKRHMLWQVQGVDSLGWLLGSLHFGRADMYPMAEAIREAWEASDELVVELDIARVDTAAMRERVVRHGVYANDTRLDLEIPAPLWDGVREAADRYGLPLVLLQQQRPWLVAVTLSTLELQRSGWSENLGIDRHFLGLARDRRPIVELESAGEQIALFGALTPAEQTAMLRSTLADLDEGSALFGRMLEAWQAGDTAMLDDIVNGSLLGEPAGARVHERLIGERNRRMAERFVERLRAGARPMMVVGAGHLVGRGGVPELLRARGYEVVQVTTSAEQEASVQ